MAGFPPFSWLNNIPWPPCLWGQLLEDYCDPLVFPWFFTFFEVLHLRLHIWSSNHLPQSLLTDFGREIPSFSPARDSEVFSALLKYTFSTLLLSFERVLNCMPSLDPVTYQDGFWQSPFCFPRGGAKAEICSLLIGLSPCACSLAVCRGSCCPWRVHGEPATA